jgi:SAM-dependent methyltransferase
MRSDILKEGAIMVRWKSPLPNPEKLCFGKEKIDTLSSYVRGKSELHTELNILEAGCGTKWWLDLRGVQYILTGVDIDQAALDIRMNQTDDLDIAIHGDLRTVSLADGEYDVIYCSNVLEHVDGAETVLTNFVRWLKPGGILLLSIPNRESARGFVTRVTPFWFHVLFYRYIRGRRNAGKPGYPPFKTYFDKVVGRQGIYAYCEKHGLEIRAEYSARPSRKTRSFLSTMSRLICGVVHLASFGKLSKEHANMTYIIEMP